MGLSDSTYLLDVALVHRAWGEGKLQYRMGSQGPHVPFMSRHQPKFEFKQSAKVVNQDVSM